MTVVVCGLMLRLSFGPLSLDAIRPYFKEATDAYGIISYHMALTWSHQRAFELLLSDLRGPYWKIKTVRLGLGLSPSWKPQITSVTLDAPSIIWSNASGKAPNFLGMLDVLYALPAITMHGGSLVFPSGLRYSDMNLEFCPKQGTGKIYSSNPKKPGNDQEATLEARLYVAKKKVNLDLMRFSFPGFDGSSLLEIKGTFMGNQHDNGTWKGELVLEQIPLPTPMALENIKINLSITPTQMHIKRGTFSIEKAFFSGHGSLRTTEKGLSGWGKVSLKKGFCSLKGLEKLWPKTRAPEVRAWILKNMPQGTLTGFEAETTLEKGALSSLRHSFAMKNVTLCFMQGQPPLQGVELFSKGTEDALRIEVSKGWFHHHLLKKGWVHITSLSKAPQLSLETTLTGSFPELLKILCSISSRKMPALTSMQGRGETTLTAQFPLGSDLKKKDINLDMKSKITQASFGIFIDKIHYRFRHGTLHILGKTGKQETFLIGGKSDFSIHPSPGVPMHWTWEKDRFFFSCHAPPAQLLPFLPSSLTPYVAFDLKKSDSVDVTGEQHSSKDGVITTLRADFKDAHVLIPMISWEKQPKTPLLVKITLHPSGYDVAMQGALKGQGKILHTGDIHMEGHLTDTEWVQYRAVGREHKLFFRGESLQLNLDPKLAPLPKHAEAPASSGGHAAIDPHEFSMDFACKKLILKEIALSNCEVYLSAKKRDAQKPWHALYNLQWIKESTIMATLQPKKPKIKASKPLKKGLLMASMVADAQGETTLQFRAEEIGALLKSIGVTENIKEGDCYLQAQQAKDGVYKGSFNLTQIRTRALPLLKLISLVSPTLFLDFGRSGLFFPSISCDFLLQGHELKLKNGIATSPNLGIMLKGKINLDTYNARMKGVVIPGYLLNTFFQYIPIFGWLLGGSKGVVSSEFALTGLLQDPKVKLYPFSFFKFGFIKDLIRGLEKQKHF